jgi:hypothetical protein
MMPLLRACVALAVAATATAAGSKPPALRVVVMAGQSNMVGHGYAEGSTLHWNATSSNPCGGTAGGCVDNKPDLPPNLNGSLLTPEFSFLGTAGAWKTRDDVWVVYNESAADDGVPAFPEGDSGYWAGELSVGFGGDHKGVVGNHTEVGPELGFGWALGEASSAEQQQQVLLIKTAWGGKTIDVDFRPPSSGGTVGPYYTWMLREVADALAKLDTLFPAYKQIGSYELAGFVWHQGWNDACRAGGADPTHYEADLANLIRDVRKDLKAPHMKVVVGTSGMCGFPNKKYPQGYQHCAGACATLAGPIIGGQLAVGNTTKYPEFEGNVAAVETRGFHYDMEQSAGNQCCTPAPLFGLDFVLPRSHASGERVYLTCVGLLRADHWNNNAQSYWHMGQALGKALLAMLDE